MEMLPEEIISNIISYIPKDKDMSSPTADIMKQARINLFYDTNDGTNYTDEEALTFQDDECEKLWSCKYFQFYRNIKEEHLEYIDEDWEDDE